VECFGLFEVGYLLDVFIYQGRGTFWKFLAFIADICWMFPAE